MTFFCPGDQDQEGMGEVKGQEAREGGQGGLSVNSEGVASGLRYYIFGFVCTCVPKYWNTTTSCIYNCFRYKSRCPD